MKPGLASCSTATPINDLFSSDGRFVVFSDGHCFSPSGDIDLTSGRVRPLREGIDPSAEDPTCRVGGSFFSSSAKIFSFRRWVGKPTVEQEESHHLNILLR